MDRNLYKISLLIIFVLTFSIFFSISSYSVEVGDSSVILQGFGWNCMLDSQKGTWYKKLSSKVDEISKCGFDIVWFPPAVRSVSKQGYMPTDYYDLGYAGNPTYYGTKSELINCIKKFHKKHIMVLADIVINHRCAGKQDENGIWNVYHFKSGKAQWEKWAICSSDKHFDGTGNKDTGEDFGAAPDIDHMNKKVRNDIIKWMLWMKKIGFDGWRYDFTKGYSPQFVKIYNMATKPKFTVGEYWTSIHYDNPDNPSYNQNSHRQKLCDWLDRAGPMGKTFDFTTKGILQKAIFGEFGRLRDRDGKAAGLIGWWPQRAVTFIDNHDTGSQQNHWPFPSNRVLQGYVYIMTHPGIPCVFWEHLFNWKMEKDISKLIHIRKKYGINSGSKLDIIRAEHGLYAAIIDGKNGKKIAMKLGWKEWKPDDDSYKILFSGKQFCIWGK